MAQANPSDSLTHKYIALRQNLIDMEMESSTIEFSEDLFKALFMGSPVGIYVLVDGRFKLANPQFQMDTGYPLGDRLKETALSEGGHIAAIIDALLDISRSGGIPPVATTWELTCPYQRVRGLTGRSASLRPNPSRATASRTSGAISTSTSSNSRTNSPISKRSGGQVFRA